MLERGYKNTFDYCVKRLNLRVGAVALRLHVANVSKRIPQLLSAIAENRVSLSVAGLLAPHLGEDNVDRVLADCRGMSKRAAEEYVVQFRPISAIPEQRSPASKKAPPPSPPRRDTPNIIQTAEPDRFN